MGLKLDKLRFLCLTYGGGILHTLPYPCLVIVNYYYTGIVDLYLNI